MLGLWSSLKEWYDRSRSFLTWSSCWKTKTNTKYSNYIQRKISRRYSRWSWIHCRCRIVIWSSWWIWISCRICTSRRLPIIIPISRIWTSSWIWLIPTSRRLSARWFPIRLVPTIRRLWISPRIWLIPTLRRLSVTSSRRFPTIRRLPTRLVPTIRRFPTRLVSTPRRIWRRLQVIIYVILINELLVSKNERK